MTMAIHIDFVCGSSSCIIIIPCVCYSNNKVSLVRRPCLRPLEYAMAGKSINKCILSSIMIWIYKNCSTVVNRKRVKESLQGEVAKRFLHPSPLANPENTMIGNKSV